MSSPADVPVAVRRRRAWNSDPVVVTVAPTGADVFRTNNPNIPYTTPEIAQSSIESAQAGASMVHLHVREDDGTPTGRPELFQDVISRIREGSELITMVSTGGANDMTIEERTTGLLAQPDLSGVESGSMNFGDETFITPPPAARGIIERATQAAIGLEVEAFDVGHVVSAVRWLEEGVIPEPMLINLVFGVPDGIDASPEALAAMLRPLPRSHSSTGRPASGRGSRTRCTSAEGCWLRPTPRWSARPSSWHTASVARSRAGSRHTRSSDSRRRRDLADRDARHAPGARAPGALPQAALRLDATLPMQPHEIELEADTLCLDSTSFRQLVDSHHHDPLMVNEAILRIVGERGKMHNPVTGSGGILTGTVRAVGEKVPEPPPIGSRLVSLERPGTPRHSVLERFAR
jgi:3-keto-5-aminohexanoate cleavage enzyme